MDHETNQQEPSSTEGGEMNYKVGDKVWVLATVTRNSDSSEYMELDYNGHEIIAHKSDCRPVEPDHDDHPVEFKVGDRVVSWSGREGVVEAINEIEGFPVTVRHSMREQVSYKLGGVKHDDHPVEPEPNPPKILDSSSDPINPSHYKYLPAKAIDIIEAAIAGAPSNKAAYLHGQALKYPLRCWEKGGVEDLKKARWYLDRLIKEVGE
jgi:hypothetical protein